MLYEDITDEEIYKSLEYVYLLDFVNQVGLDYIVGNDGNKLSGGQKHRLQLAICLAKQKDIILLDEPTSNVDSINEGIILKSLVQQKKDKCIILVFHRESAIAISDHCYRFENGKLIEFTK